MNPMQSPNTGVGKKLCPEGRECLSMKDDILKKLDELYAFGKLTETVVDNFSITTGIDCHDLCRKSGIIYRVRDKTSKKDLLKIAVSLKKLLSDCLSIDDKAMLELDDDKHYPSHLRVEIEQVLEKAEEAGI